MKVYHKKFKTGGFTLIELIVVIAILGILAAIAVPRLGGFSTSAKNKVDEANAKILTKIAAKIHAETGNFPSETEWGASFTEFATSTYLDKAIEIQSKDHAFEYNDTTGIVTVYKQGEVETSPVIDPPTSGGSPLQSIINSTPLHFSDLANADSKNPVIILPSAADITYTFTEGSSKGNANVSIGDGGTTATIKRPPGGTRYLTLTLKATKDGETVTRTYHITVPKEGNVTVQ